MEQRLMHIFSNIGKHILGTLLKAFRQDLRGSSVLVFLIVAVGVEAASVFLSGGKFPPDGTTHLAAAALALAFGYAVGITVAVEEILRGIVKSIELIVKETEKLAGEAISEVEKLGKGALHEAGALGRGAVGTSKARSAAPDASSAASSKVSPPISRAITPTRSAYQSWPDSTGA